MERSRTAKYGRALTLSLSVALALGVFLPNGSYRISGNVVLLNALSAPFSDYGSSELGVGVIVLVVVGALWATRRRPKQSELGAVIAYAGILGLILPDLWLRNTTTVTNGAHARTMNVSFVYGFWINLSVVVLLVTVSSLLVVQERNSRPAS
ncbi:MAG TPA: hypothetical protein VGZ04_09720 [Acidimicrobiales bacterium]|jgi:hypothetical protein|nr:hypothetical protein [Acidimicrobiales bacterium]